MVVVVGTAMVVASVAAFLAAQAVLSGHRATFSLSDPAVLRVVIGTGVYLTLICLLGSAVAWIIRSTPGSLVGVFGLILVIPVLLLFLGSWGKDVVAYLPTGAGASFSTSLRMPGSLPPWPGLAVMVAWVVVAFLVAAWELRRRDA